jgi:hypothetical protein
MLEAATHVACPFHPISTSPTHVALPKIATKVANTQVATRFTLKSPAAISVAASNQEMKHRLPHSILLVPLLMFTNLFVSRTLAQGKIVVAVDSTRLGSDPFKLPTSLLGVIQTGIDALESGDTGTHQAEGSRAESSATARAAFDKLEAVLRMGYTGIQGIIGSEILPTGITPADRLGVFTTYGWEKSQLGRFTDERLLVLGELALQGATTIATPAWRYADTLTPLIQSQLDIIEAEEPSATGGGRQVSVAARTTLGEQLATSLSRARFHYCAASDDLDTTKELARISFQPRRPKSTAAATAVTPPAA